MIAPFWSGSDTVGENDGIYASNSSKSAIDYTTISFATSPEGSVYTTPASQFAVQLGSDGSIVFKYGANLNGLASVIGVSAGITGDYTLASNNGKMNLSNSASIVFRPDAAKALTYYDIGAIEFEGSSNDSTLPTITGTTNLPANGATTDAVFTSITLQFSTALDLISAQSPANYQLLEAGPDGKFGTSDDVTIAVTPVYSAATDTVTLLLPAGALADGMYQLTVSGSNKLLDASGNPLNGDDNSENSPSDFVSQFTIDRSADKPPVVSNSSVTTPGNASIPFTLKATDPQGLPITFAIVTPPRHGAIENFNPDAGTFTYVPEIGYTGRDTIVYSATDAKLAQSEADISIAVTAYRTPPVASAETATAVAGQALTITLEGYDALTPANKLVLAIVKQPSHGVLTITGQNTVSYLASAGYSGADSFSYVWGDNGSPALTSAPAIVSIAVVAPSQALIASATTTSVVENQRRKIPDDTSVDNGGTVYGGGDTSAPAVATIDVPQKTTDAVSYLVSDPGVTGAQYAHGSHPIAYAWVPGKIEGVNYLTDVASYNVSGLPAVKSYYGANGSVVAATTYSSSGVPTTVLAAEDAAQSNNSLAVARLVDPSDGPTANELSFNAAVRIGPVAQSYEKNSVAKMDENQPGTRVGAPSTDALLFGAALSSPRADAKLEYVIGPAPSRESLRQAFFLDGIVLPIATAAETKPSDVAARKDPQRSWIATFDLLTDRFESVEAELEPCDLPSAMHFDIETIEWELVN